MTSALIFGYNDYSSEIANNISSQYENITIFKLDSNYTKKENINFNVKSFDLSDNWDELSDSYDIVNSIAFCVLEDEAENIFLTISLRSEFKDLKIIALSKNKESSNKLEMAGASKVIPVVQTTADIISDMLEKPIITKVLHKILYEESELKIAQIQIECVGGHFKNKYPHEIDWSHEYKVIVLSIMHEDMSSEFIYSSKAKHHHIKNGDVFIVVGYEEDIKKFENTIGGSICQLG